MTENDIVWETPPPGNRHNNDWAVLLAPFMERPGEWGRLCEKNAKGTANSLATQLRRHFYGTMPPGKFDARSVSQDGHFYVYVRYLGPETP